MYPLYIERSGCIECYKLYALYVRTQTEGPVGPNGDAGSNSKSGRFMHFDVGGKSRAVFGHRYYAHSTTLNNSTNVSHIHPLLRGLPKPALFLV